MFNKLISLVFVLFFGNIVLADKINYEPSPKKLDYIPGGSPKPVAPPQIIPYKPQVVPADFHSHTCANNHTWFHSSSDPTASHQCPVCGLSQYIVDPGSMGKAPSTQPFPQQNGCPGGVCPIPQQQPWRLFPRLRR